jgi:hypothetical protein
MFRQSIAVDRSTNQFLLGTTSADLRCGRTRQIASAYECIALSVTKKKISISRSAAHVSVAFVLHALEEVGYAGALIRLKPCAISVLGASFSSRHPSGEL